VEDVLELDDEQTDGLARLDRWPDRQLSRRGVVGRCERCFFDCGSVRAALAPPHGNIQVSISNESYRSAAITAAAVSQPFAKWHAGRRPRTPSPAISTAPALAPASATKR
jgi:hypothetical protein